MGSKPGRHVVPLLALCQFKSGLGRAGRVGGGAGVGTEVCIPQIGLLQDDQAEEAHGTEPSA